MMSISSSSDGQQASHKEESRKLKAFIVKMKKELSEAKERVSALRCLFCHRYIYPPPSLR